MANAPHFEVYPRHRRPAEGERWEPDPDGGFGWRFRDDNGRITFASGEGFTRREDAHRAICGAAADVLGQVLGMEAKPFSDIFEKPDAIFPTRIVDVDE